MKKLKYLLWSVFAIISTFILLGFILFATQPYPPQKTIKISPKGWQLNSAFHQINKNFWEQRNNTLYFNNQIVTPQKVSLYSDLLPSENKKKGYITTSIKIPAQFNLLPDDCLYGLQIGEQNAAAKEQLFIGLNGKGNVVILDGALNPLVDETVKLSTKLFDDNCCAEIKLSIHYYKNPSGWVLFFSANNGEEKLGGIVNHIPFEKLNLPEKEIALVAFNPSQQGNIWFKDWQIQNDWTPND